jgi:hypothetical protein
MGRPGGFEFKVTFRKQDPGQYSYQPIQIGRAFDMEVSNVLNDHNRHYVHGGNKYSWGSRIKQGEEKGFEDGAMIVNRITDKYGNIVETIKIITHSMGSAFGKGYLKGLIKYLKKIGIYDKVLISLVADFDPFQGSELTAEENTYTQQFWHD